MAIELEFIDFVVPIATIDAKYPGGWAGFLIGHASSFGGANWFDQHLFRDGAMNPRDMMSLVEDWERLGFTPMETRNGKQVWKDVCVVESMWGGPTLPCDWLEVDGDRCIAWLAGTEPGEVANMNMFARKD